MATVTWSNALGGSWETGADWSGGTVPGTNDIAEITQAGSYTINIGTTEAVQSLLLNDPGATLTLSSTLKLAQALTLAAGTLQFNNGALNGGTVVSAGGTLAGVGEIDNLSWLGSLSLTNTDLSVYGGLNVAAIGGGAGTIALTNARLDFFSAATLGAAGVPVSIVVSGTQDYLRCYGAVTLGAAAALAIGTGTDLVVDGINSGSLAQGGAVTVTGGTFDLQGVTGNTGTIAIGSGGTLLLDSVFQDPFQNAGTILFSDATGVVAVAHTIATGALGTIAGAAGTLQDNGFLNNAGGTITVGPGSEFGVLSLAGTLSGGTVVNSGGSVLANGGTLAGVSWVGPLSIAAGTNAYLDWISVTQGLSVTAAGGGTGTVTVANASLHLPGTAAIDNIVVQLSSSNGAEGLNSANLTIGSHATVTTSSAIDVGTLTNNGTITATASVLNSGTSVTNAGTIAAANSGTTLFLAAQTIANSGLFDVANGATLELGYLDTRVGVSAQLANTGTIRLDGGASRLVLVGTVTTSGLGTIVDPAGGAI